jgi:hypothetical protein
MLGADPNVDAGTLATVMWPGVGPSTGVELVTVQVADAAGNGLDDAVIVASLWPSFEARRSMKIGDVFNLTPVDRVAVTGGRAAVHADDVDLLRAHQSKNGEIMVHLDVYTGQGTTTVLVVERVQDNEGRWVDSAARNTAATDPVAPVQFALGENQLGRLVTSSGDTASPLELRDHQGVTCSVMEYAGPVSMPETVATTAVYKGIKANVTYTSSATTTSGLGFQVDAGLWSQNGTATRSSTLTGTFVTVTGSSTAWTNKEYRASWQHDRYYRHCADPNVWPPDGSYITQRFTEPVKAVGFPAIIDSRYPLPGCHTKQPLTGVVDIDTESHAAITHSAGFKITWGIGSFEGSSKSGYSTSVKIKFTNPSPGTYWYWCGDAFAPQDSYRVRSGR